METLKAVIFDLDDTLLDWRGHNAGRLEVPRFVDILEAIIKEAGYVIRVSAYRCLRYFSPGILYTHKLPANTPNCRFRACVHPPKSN